MKKLAVRTCAWACLCALLGFGSVAAFAAKDIGEGYARPTYRELMQSFILLNGFDIQDPKIADEYGRIVYCDLYLKNFKNDIVWKRTRDEIVSRAQRKKEYFRTKFEMVSQFSLGRYEFTKQFFPLAINSRIRNVGNIQLFAGLGGDKDVCTKMTTLPNNIEMQLTEPLTVEGFSVPKDKVEKMMVRLEGQGRAGRTIYGRVRMTLSDAVKGISYDAGHSRRVVLRGRINAVDFFIDPELTKSLGGIQFTKD